ncbi:MAG: hypothetical protein ACLT5P_02645 [Flavonifractor plautii]
MRTVVLGVGFDDLTLEEAAAAGAALVEAGGFHYAVTPNPEFLLAAKHNPAFRQACWGPIWCWPTAWGWSTPRKSWAAR